MAKNKGKGGKSGKSGKNSDKKKVNEKEKREILFKEDGQEYVLVLRMLGNGRCEGMCADGVKRLCHIRGAMHKKIWIHVGDIVLVGLRDYQEDKADIFHKYTEVETRSLKAYGELPEIMKLYDQVLGGGAAALLDDQYGFGKVRNDDEYIEFFEDDQIDNF